MFVCDRCVWPNNLTVENGRYLCSDCLVELEWMFLDKMERTGYDMEWKWCERCSQKPASEVLLVEGLSVCQWCLIAWKLSRAPNQEEMFLWLSEGAGAIALSQPGTCHLCGQTAEYGVIDKTQPGKVWCEDRCVDKVWFDGRRDLKMLQDFAVEIGSDEVC